MSSQTCGNLSPGVFVFVVRPDQEEIGIIVALEIGVQLGIKESERYVVFTKMNSRRDVEHLGLR